MGHLQHFAHIKAGLPPADRYVGDETVTEGWAFLFQYLVADPEWLAGELRMPRDAIAGWLDFGAFRKLYFLRRYGAKLLYELRLHRGGERWCSARVRRFLGLRGPHAGRELPGGRRRRLCAARYLRGAWRRPACRPSCGIGRRRWWRPMPRFSVTVAAGLGPSAEDVVASLGYDHLDWRPVLRQIRAQLIGAMSGYGGPNITTRAGSRKV
jgi:hypothetical protein